MSREGADGIAPVAEGPTNRPLRILLLGRTRRRIDGGLGRSIRMIRSHLKKVGNHVVLRSCNAPLVTAKGFDLVWHYGDRAHLDQQYAKSMEEKVPFLVNSEFDNSSSRVSLCQDLAKQKPNIWQVVFTEHARQILRSAGVKRVVVLPKTIRLMPQTLGGVSFQDRQGICIGELAKLRRERLVRGISIDEAVAAIRRATDEPIFSYSQYTTDEHVPFEGTETVPKPGDDMPQFLTHLKLFVSLSSHETFYMVPAEAQTVGTPVLYRSMPQSLTEHIGMTGAVFDTPRELELLVSRILSDKKIWLSYSGAGSQSAMARSILHAGAALDMQLRKFVFGRGAW